MTPRHTGAVAGQPEQARLWISGLGFRRHGPGLDEAKALRQHGLNDLGVFVEPGGKADRISKFQAP